MQRFGLRFALDGRRFEGLTSFVSAPLFIARGADFIALEMQRAFCKL